MQTSDWSFQTEAQNLLQSAAFRESSAQVLKSITEASSKLQAVRPSSSDAGVREQYAKLIKEYGQNRGRDLFYPIITSGLGSGPFFELLDGSVKYDMICGIGINFFGHSHPKLIAEMMNGLSADIMQGNLQPGHEATSLLSTLLSKVGKGSRLKHGWVTTCGTMANELALKSIRQKKSPATKILAFQDCFAGRSTAMQEVTDNPGYRQGQPVYGEVYYLSFYDPKLGLEASIQRTVQQLKEHTQRFPGKFAALMIELVQGEGGFNYAPRDYYVQVFEAAKKADLAIWADEIQTFGRTGEYFAYQKLGLNEYIDVVTLAKMVQTAAVLYTDEYNPKPGLIAGTFSGSSMALRAARRILELLEEEKHLGPDGHIEKMSQYFMSRLNALAENECKGLLGARKAIGGMIAFEPLSGSLEDVKATLMKLYDLGVIGFYCGHGPYLIRFLPPLPVMNEKHVDEVCAILAQALKEVASQRKV